MLYTIRYTLCEQGKPDYRRCFQSTFTLKEARAFLRDLANDCTRFETPRLHAKGKKLVIYDSDTSCRQYEIIRF
ncbi:hypothetical protein [Duncaniella dubosii]|uniref:hypothetical protein n=1 Tax=Duncaniella dubosii TaxID=2518971 RepID=UPI0023F57E98|nr:hypothetical protein [Duncaniella dubosii]MCX4285041.1 hypothetical protein [Duncaniella dubosii]